MPELEFDKFTLEEKDTLKDALQHYGRNKQFIKAAEEAGEFTQVVAKIAFNGSVGDQKQNLVSEVADLEILLAQIKLTAGIEEAVTFQRSYKIHRLRKRIEVEKYESINS